MMSTALLTLWTGDSASIFRKRFAMYVACLTKPCSSTKELTPDEVSCSAELLLLVHGVMNSRLISTASNSCRHSGHLEVSSLTCDLSTNSSMHDQQYVCPANDDGTGWTLSMGALFWNLPQGRERISSNLKWFTHIGQSASLMSKLGGLGAAVCGVPRYRDGPRACRVNTVT